MSPSYRALGLESRKVAWGIAIVGLITTPVLVGLPLLVWGVVADVMLAKHRKATAKVAPGPKVSGKDLKVTRDKNLQAIHRDVKSLSMDD